MADTEPNDLETAPRLSTPQRGFGQAMKAILDAVERFDEAALLRAIGNDPDGVKPGETALRRSKALEVEGSRPRLAAYAIGPSRSDPQRTRIRYGGSVCEIFAYAPPTEPDPEHPWRGYAMYPEEILTRLWRGRTEALYAREMHAIAG